MRVKTQMPLDLWLRPNVCSDEEEPVHEFDEEEEKSCGGLLNVASVWLGVMLATVHHSA